MKVGLLASTLLAVASLVQGDRMQSTLQLPVPAQNEKAEVDAVTPAPTTYAPMPALALTDVNRPTPAPTEGATYTDRTGARHSTGTAVGVAYITTRSAYEAEKNAGNSNSTIPIVVIACCVGAIGAVAAATIISKRRTEAADTEDESETGYSNAMCTPVATDKRSYSGLIALPAEVYEVDYIDELDELDDIDAHAV
ncbi:unnamed protein product [Hyaloperonospora brassicae]|uniref:RxLR effector candidate protein n=1 Tax=Hyaloperonospora brassicae TaxID=162125 RepID=A0AAV0U6G8_HYABA|nr:unnamed protein product [Hyaloperonospora brassicae]